MRGPFLFRSLPPEVGPGGLANARANHEHSIRMKLKLYLGGALLLATLVFSVQNSAVVDVKFLAWKFSTSLALVIFATLAAGLIGGWAIFSALRLANGAGKK